MNVEMITNILFYLVMFFVSTVSMAVVVLPIWFLYKFFSRPSVKDSLNHFAITIADRLPGTGTPAAPLGTPELSGANANRTSAAQAALDSIAGAQQSAQTRQYLPVWAQACLALWGGLVIALILTGYGDSLIVMGLIVGSSFLITHLRSRYCGVAPNARPTVKNFLMVAVFLALLLPPVLWAKGFVATHGEIYGWLIGAAEALIVFVVLILRRKYGKRIAT